MKKQLILTIDEGVIDKAKKQIPNISGFVEECLKQYLGIGNNLIPTHKMQELNDTICRCQLELYLMNERTHIEEAKEKAALQEINLAWRRLYAEYRDQRVINKDRLQHASDILNVTPEELADIVEVAFVFRDSFTGDITEWSDVYKEYGGD